MVGKVQGGREGGERMRSAPTGPGFERGTYRVLDKSPQLNAMEVQHAHELNPQPSLPAVAIMSTSFSNECTGDSNCSLLTSWSREHLHSIPTIKFIYDLRLTSPLNVSSIVSSLVNPAALLIRL